MLREIKPAVPVHLRLTRFAVTMPRIATLVRQNVRLSKWLGASCGACAAHNVGACLAWVRWLLTSRLVRDDAVNWGGAATLAAGWMLWPAVDKEFKASLFGGGPKKEDAPAKK